MSRKKLKRLSENIHLKCSVCMEHEASHICIYEWKGLNVQLCLCPACTKLGNNHLAPDFLKDS